MMTQLHPGTKKDTGKLQNRSIFFNEISCSFGNGEARPARKVPDWPGPAHGYKVSVDKGFIGTHIRQEYKRKDKKPDLDEGFQHYYIKTANMSPRFSFGVNVGSQLMKTERRNLPAHLRREKTSPGPGQYESKSSIQMSPRHNESTQQCTW